MTPRLTNPSTNRVTHIAFIGSAIIAALYFGKSVFVPLALAVLLSFILSPLVSGLRKLRAPRPVAVGVVVLSMIICIGLLGMATTRQLSDLAGDIPRYEATLRAKSAALRTGLGKTGALEKASATIKVLSKELEKPATSGVTGGVPTSSDTAPRPIAVEVYQPPEKPLETMWHVASAVIEPLATSGVVLILVIFILLQREDTRDRLIRLIGAGRLHTTTEALNDAAFRMSRLLLVQTAMNATYGIVIAGGLWAIGIPSPVLWGVVAAVMRFLPYIGSILSAIGPVLLAAAVDPGWSLLGETLALFLIMEPLVGHFIEPWLQGQTTGLSPLAVVISAIIWTALWGPVGLVLATPLTMCLVVIGRHVDGLDFLDVILGDEPALTPPEVFYQRLLSGAGAEVAEQADHELEVNSLVAYLDDVAIAGLRLAVIDARRGHLDAAHMAEMRDGLTVLLEDLRDKLAPPSTGVIAPAANAAGAVDKDARTDLTINPNEQLPRVLCLGGRTPLDAAAAELLCLLLFQNYIPARTEALARIADLVTVDLSGIDVVWLSSLDPPQSPSYLRYMMRRLRRSSPSLKIYIGLWGAAPGEAAIDKLISENYETSLNAALAKTLLITREDGALNHIAPGAEIGRFSQANPVKLDAHAPS